MDTNGDLKSLLLRDLAARLPYGVKVQYKNSEPFNLERISLFSINGLYEIDDCRLYLRPMSSMTSEEFEEYTSIISHITIGKVNYSIADPESFDWLNKNMFDYRGLIERGLAIEAPAGMYNIKEK